MANELLSGFFNSVNGDRTYDADDLRMPYLYMLGSGVLAPSISQKKDSFKISKAPQSALGISLSPGLALGNGRWVNNIGYYTLTLSPNSTASDRTDHIILRIDGSAAARGATVFVVSSTGKVSEPSLSDDEFVKDLHIGSVIIRAGASTISNIDISDYRGSVRCPWITGLVNQPDTSQLFTQYKAAYDSTMSQLNNLLAGVNARIDTVVNSASTSLTQITTEAQNAVTTAENTISQVDELRTELSTNLADALNALDTLMGEKINAWQDQINTVITSLPKAQALVSSQYVSDGSDREDDQTVVANFTWDVSTDVVMVFLNGILTERSQTLLSNGNTVKFSTSLSTEDVVLIYKIGVH